MHALTAQVQRACIAPRSHVRVVNGCARDAPPPCVTLGVLLFVFFSCPTRCQINHAVVLKEKGIEWVTESMDGPQWPVL